MTTMQGYRVKIFTRSFDLKLYRLSKGLYEGLKDAYGREIPCVRLTDQTADGYFLTMLKDRDCDIAVNIDEDAFLIDPEALLDLVKTVAEEGFANAGYSESLRGFDPRVTNPFFNVLNLALIRTRFDRKALSRSADDKEPYYPFFRWVADNFPVLYLPCHTHPDGVTTIARDAQDRTVCLHTWYSRFYSMPAWMVRRIDPAGTQKDRIDAIIREAYALRQKEIPAFNTADRAGFLLNRTLRWLIKVPQRIARWPYKLYHKLHKSS